MNQQLGLNPKSGVVVFTDGSASYKDRSGGWGWIAIDAQDTEITNSGSEHNTTVNRMELMAVIDALIHLFETYGSCCILIYSDSEYVVLGCRDPNRVRRKNKDLWNKLDAAIRSHEYIEWNHVRGHSDSHYNDVADKLAGEARIKGLEEYAKVE